MYKVITTILLILAFSNSFAQQYTFKANAPTARAAMACGVLTTGTGEVRVPQIFVCGGTVFGQSSDIVEAYDVMNNTWSAKPSLITPVLEAFGATVYNKLYVIGGYTTSGTATGAVQEYDPSTNTWTMKASMPTPRSQLSGAVINNKIYVVGGWSGQYNTLEIYDPVTDTWTTGANLPYGVIQNNGGVAINNDLYIIGGKDYAWTGAYDFNSKYSITGNTWTAMSPMPAPRFSGAAVNYNGKIHFFGGATTSWLVNFDTHYVYDPSTDIWSSGLVMPVSRVSHVAAVANNKVYIIGGADAFGTPVNTTIEYSEPLLGIPSLPIGNKAADISCDQGLLHIKYHTPVSELAIIDVNGRTVANFRSPANTLDLRFLPKGMYIVKLSGDGNLQTEKIML